MKFRILLFSATLLVGACNNKPNTSETTTIKTTDSPTEAETKDDKTINNKVDGNPSTAPSSGNLSSEGDNTAKAKKGWSKTAKGAVIGGVIGAGTGAIVDKKHRAVGAIVGGAAGAGAGAIVGNQLDKKDGRH